MSTFISITNLAKEILEQFPGAKTLNTYFATKDAQFNLTYNQHSIIPIMMFVDKNRYDNTQINELFGNGNKVKITFSQNDKKKIQKYSPFNKITIDLSVEKSFIDKVTNKTIKYFNWTLTKYNNAKLQEAYDNMYSIVDDDDPLVDEIENLPEDNI